MRIRASELRIGDQLRINDETRTVSGVHVGTAETRVDLAGDGFPASFILWNGDDCKIVWK